MIFWIILIKLLVSIELWNVLRFIQLINLEFLFLS